MFSSKLFGMVLAAVLVVACSQGPGLQIAGNPVTNPGGIGGFGGSAQPGGFGGSAQPGGFTVGTGAGAQVPVQSQTNPFQQYPVTDPYQSLFVGGQNPWSYLNSVIPQARPNVSQSSTVVPAGTYQLTPASSGLGGFYQIMIAPPITLVNNAPGCNGQLSGQIIPGLVICLNFAPTATPMPVPIQFSLQTQAGVTNSVLYVLIVPSNGTQGTLSVAQAIPPIQINEVIGKNGPSGQVLPSTFIVTGNNMPLGMILTSNDPTTQIVPQGSSWSVTTLKRGPLNLTAVNPQTNAPIGTLQAFVPLIYTVTVKGKYGCPLNIFESMKFICTSSGAQGQMAVQDGNGGQFMLPLGGGSVTSPMIQRSSSDHYAHAIIQVPGNVGSISCQGQVVSSITKDVDVDFMMNIH